MQAPFQLTIFKGWSQNHLFHRPLLLPYLHIRYFGSHQQIWAVCVDIEFKCWNLKWIDNKAVASALCTRPRKVPLGKSWESGDPLFREREFRHDLWTVCVCVCALVCYCVYTHVYMCVRVHCAYLCVSVCAYVCVCCVCVCTSPWDYIWGERGKNIRLSAPSSSSCTAHFHWKALHKYDCPLCPLWHICKFAAHKESQFAFYDFMDKIFIRIGNL